MTRVEARSQDVARCLPRALADRTGGCALAAVGAPLTSAAASTGAPPPPPPLGALVGGRALGAPLRCRVSSSSMARLSSRVRQCGCVPSGSSCAETIESGVSPTRVSQNLNHHRMARRSGGGDVSCPRRWSRRGRGRRPGASSRTCRAVEGGRHKASHETAGGWYTSSDPQAHPALTMLSARFSLPPILRATPALALVGRADQCDVVDAYDDVQQRVSEPPSPFRQS